MTKTVSIEVYRYHTKLAQDRNNRVCAMLSLIEAALRMEEEFQEQHFANVRPPNDKFIPSLGQVINVVEACVLELETSWEELGSELGFGGAQEVSR